MTKEEMNQTKDIEREYHKSFDCGCMDGILGGSAISYGECGICNKQVMGCTISHVPKYCDLCVMPDMCKYCGVPLDSE